MPTIRKPRSGSMQFWPRKRALKETARVRSWPKSKEAKLSGFAGYKAGMTHILYTDSNPKSPTKGSDVRIPVTIIECPPLKVMGATFFKKTTYGIKTVSQIFAKNLDKELKRKITLAKKEPKSVDDVKEFDDMKIIVHTQPKLTGIGKKKPEIFEMDIGGKKDDKLNFIKENLGKEISVKDTLKEGEQVEIHAVTRGKGFQGPVKRFGVSIRNHKSEKTIRGPGSLGGWVGHAHGMPRVAHAGQMGYHLRTEFNKQVVKISDQPKDVNPKGGLINYGVVKNDFILVKGSIAGPKKRLIRLNHSTRPNKLVPSTPLSISYISKESKQGI